MRAPHQLTMRRLFLASIRHIPLFHGSGPKTPELLKSTEYANVGTAGPSSASKGARRQTRRYSGRHIGGCVGGVRRNNGGKYSECLINCTPPLIDRTPVPSGSLPVAQTRTKLDREHCKTRRPTPHGGSAAAAFGRRPRVGLVVGSGQQQV